MRVLLTGHEGYVGQGLFQAFAERHHVLGWGRKDDLFSLNRKTLEQHGIEAIVNCAAIIEREQTAYDTSSPTHRVNVQGAEHLEDVLKGTNIAWFQISTKDVFGSVYDASSVSPGTRGDRPIFLVEENRPLAPHTIYAKSKAMAEEIAARHPFANIIRLSTCYTDFSHPRGNWMVRMMRAAVRGEPVPVTHTGKQFRDPLHATDLARLIELFMEKRLYGIKVNAGGGEENIISVLELLDLMQLKYDVKLIPGGDFGFAFNINRAEQLTGWTPRIRIRECLPVLLQNIRAGNDMRLMR